MPIIAKSKLQTTGLSKGIKTLAPSHTFSENVKCAHNGKQCRCLKKLKQNYHISQQFHF